MENSKEYLQKEYIRLSAKTEGLEVGLKRLFQYMHETLHTHVDEWDQNQKELAGICIAHAISVIGLKEIDNELRELGS